uniref:G-protein coupled receptors family 2 profile 2 domain-containing protein n=1 Tax=Romanomermis culicivorax TaxID=13658 RepID=A0A915JGT5_ROMCU
GILLCFQALTVDKLSLKIPDAVLNQAAKIKQNRSTSAGFNAMQKFFESEQSKQPYRSQKIRVATVRHRDHRFYSDSTITYPPKMDDDDELPCLEIFVQNIEYETKLNETISFSIDLREHYRQMKKMGRGSSRADSPMNPLAQKQYTCVYWNEKDNKWDTKGVTTYKRMDGDQFLVICNTDHLTGFSILLDFNQKIVLDDDNQFALNLLSWIGCGCSIVGLLLTIITYTLFSSARPFVEYSMLFCIGLGMALHYITLSTLLWMGVEAAHMYRMLVHVFAMSERHFMLKRYSVAYESPTVADKNFRIFYFWIGLYDIFFVSCRLSPTNKLVHYGAFLGPACLILVCNCGVFICVLRVLYMSNDTKKPRAHYQSQQQYASQVPSTKPSNMITQIRGALSVMVLLGVTWIFGAFSFGPARLPFMYTFCVLNSAQGFIIFLVRCLLYDETRGAWLMLLRSGKLKKYKEHVDFCRFSLVFLQKNLRLVLLIVVSQYLRNNG